MKQKQTYAIPAFVEDHDPIRATDLLVTSVYKSRLEDECEVVIEVTPNDWSTFYHCRVHLNTDTVMGEDTDIMAIATVCADGEISSDPTSIVLTQAHNDYETYYLLRG